MRKITQQFIVYTFLLCLFNQPMLAQGSYRLFRPNVQYLYANPLAPSRYSSPVLGIKLGSQICETTYTSAQVSPFEMPEACILRVSAFIGSQVCHNEQATQLTITSPDGFSEVLTIRQKAGVGESWQAMSGNQTIYGRVEAVVEEDFLGLSDSVKYIALYLENDAGGLVPLYEEIPLRISRNYGLLSGVFMHWLGEETGNIELLGMSNPPVGLQNPSRGSIFQLEAGDLLHLKFKQTENTPALQHIHTEDQATVTDVWWNSDNTLLRYTFEADRKRYFEGLNASTDTIYTEGETYVEEISWPQLAYLDRQPGSVYPDQNLPNSVRVVALIPDAFCEQAAKQLQIPMLNPLGNCYFPWSDAQEGPAFYDQLSGPYYSFASLDGFDTRELRYVRLNSGYTCGEPFDVMVNTHTLNPTDILLYPNPARDYAQLSWDQSWASTILLDVYDCQGRCLMRNSLLNNGQKIDLTSWSAGIYLLKCRMSDGLSCWKRLVIR